MRYPDSEAFYKQVGDKIRQLRKEKEWSQTELGYQSELDKSVIQRIERGAGNSTLKTLLKVANALDVQFYELFLF
ncbi:helix-turn-helix transcriptional regulator [uncultured Dokdonia sp.]|uniref:helix-turn-helix domain-containing protein n=1 Tax=uncultured Dokdonia sp. TaxID=575653 RepID=UPI00262EEC67|nr:helix-turn-helix transcriptional regulator [uncultured Dokdonia sp.]